MEKKKVKQNVFALAGITSLNKMRTLVLFIHLRIISFIIFILGSKMSCESPVCIVWTGWNIDVSIFLASDIRHYPALSNLRNVFKKKKMKTLLSVAINSFCVKKDRAVFTLYVSRVIVFCIPCIKISLFVILYFHLVGD